MTYHSDGFHTPGMTPPMKSKRGSISKKALISLPEAMLKEIDALAEAESRTRSELVRQALRVYMESKC
jgi:CopG family transcriptional regulator/antitoxin EndoAI